MAAAAAPAAAAAGFLVELLDRRAEGARLVARRESEDHGHDHLRTAQWGGVMEDSAGPFRQGKTAETKDKEIGARLVRWSRCGASSPQGQ